MALGLCNPLRPLCSCCNRTEVPSEPADPTGFRCDGCYHEAETARAAERADAFRFASLDYLRTAAEYEAPPRGLVSARVHEARCRALSLIGRAS